MFGESIILALFKNFGNKLLLSIILALISILLLHLGNWQLQRYHHKQHLTKIASKAAQQKPQYIKSLGEIKNNWLHKTIKLTGQFVKSPIFLLDNQHHNGRVGYTILVPFQVAKKIILVNKGFIGKYQILPELDLSAKTIEGTLGNISTGILLLEDDYSKLEDVKIIQAINYRKISQYLGVELIEYILQNKEQAINFGLPAQQHLGYAVQWYALALTCAIYSCINLRKKNAS